MKMSVQEVLTERTNDDIRAEKEIEEFYQHVVKHSRANSVVEFTAGSRSEIRGQEIILIKYGLNTDELLDHDRMDYHKGMYAFPGRSTVPEEFSGKVIWNYSAGSNAGYAKLCYENSNAKLQYSDICGKLIGVRHGPADKYNNVSILCDQFAGLYPQLSHDRLESNLARAAKIQDRVSAVHCPYWPTEANEWIVRQRPNGFPSMFTIKQIVRYGCDFVQVSHKLSNDCNEWRYSFSKAELTILHSWTTAQKIVYRTFHLLFKIMKSRMNSILCSYYFKTLMLWATEEKPVEFWSEDVLTGSVCELVLVLTEWLRMRFCPNYFIPSNNMIDHLTDTDLSPDVDVLCQLLQFKSLVAEALHASRELEIDIATRTYQIEAPMWLYTSLVIYDQICHSEERETQRFARNFSALLYKASNFELFNIYLGLMCFRKATNNLIYCIDMNYLLTSYIFKHFQSCKRPISYWKQCVYLQHCSSTVCVRMLNLWFVEYEPDSHKISTHHMMDTSLNTISVDDIETHHKFLLYSQTVDDLDMIARSDHFNENVGSKNEISIALYTTSTVDNNTSTVVKFYKEFPGMTPTVSISWFINKAYLANFYYTIRNDCSATEQICDNIINTYKLSFLNHIFADSVLPVILSTEWTIYDKELQAMLGFYSLCSIVFNKTDRSRSVCLGVCPVLLAWYLKCRCAADQMDIERWNKCFIDTQLYLNRCESDKNVCNGSWALCFALQVTKILFQPFLA